MMKEHDPSYELRILKVREASFINYSYMIIDRATRQAAVIDPAWELDTVTSALAESDATLSTILLTHSHFDHVNLVDSLIDLFQPRVYMARQEVDAYAFTCRNLHPVHDLDVIPLGQTSLTCILTPGHTAGGLCFQTDGSLFTGDTVFIEGCGLCSAPGGDPERMYESIQRIKETVDPRVRIYPGHSYGKEVGYTLRYVMDHNLYFQIDSKDSFIRFRMRKHQKRLFDFK